MNGLYPWMGQLRGGEAALASFLKDYRAPEELGLVITLPCPDWDKFAMLVRTTAPTQSAGETDIFDVYTFPGNIRGRLLGVRLVRDSGDNTLVDIQVRYPTEYVTNFRSMALVESGAIADLYWPDAGALQQTTTTYQLASVPLLVEPGTTIRATPSGAGVSATVWHFELVVEGTHIIRDRAPVLS